MRLAVIDAGSNAIKFRLWQADSAGGASELLTRREPVRLGAPVFASGRLDEKTMADAVRAVQRLARTAQVARADAIRAVATSAMREAANAGELVEALMNEAGIALEVISEAEEARLVALGALARHPAAAADYLVFDIGGGSVEVIRGGEARSRDWRVAASMPLGAVRMTERFFPALPPAPEAVELAAAHMRAALGAAFPHAGDDTQCACLAGGGTIQALDAALPRETPELPLDAIENMVARLTALDAAGASREIGFDTRRAEIILAGALAAREVLRHFNMSGLHCAATSLADGVLAEWLAGLRSAE